MSSWGLARRSIIRLVITIPRIMFPIYIMRTYRQASSVVYQHCFKTVLMKSWHCVFTGKLTAWRQMPRQKMKERKVTFHAVRGNALHLPPTNALSHHLEFLPRNGFAPFPKEWFLMKWNKAKAKLKKSDLKQTCSASVPTWLCRCLAYKGCWLYKPFLHHVSTLRCTAYPLWW